MPFHTQEEFLALDEHKRDAVVARKLMGGPSVPYTTEISWAMEVAEKMISCGYQFSLQFLHPLQHWRVEINPGYARSESLPLAICMAALRAAGEMTIPTPPRSVRL